MFSYRLMKKGKLKVLGYAAIVSAILLAFAPGLMARTTTISSLPYTASMAGTNYSETLLVAGTNLRSTTNGIRFTGHDIVLNLGGDTITFGTNGSDAAYGLQIGGPPNAYNIKIIGGWVIHGITNDTLSDQVDCFRVSAPTHDVLVQGTNMKVSGDNAHCIDYDSGGRSSYNIDINGGQYWNFCRRYRSREYYDGAVIRTSFAGTSGSYNVRIRGVRVWTGPGQGIVCTGSWGSNPGNSRAQVYSCTVSVDHRNDFYPVNQGPNHPIGFSSENAYGLFFSFCGPGTAVHDNVVRSGTSYGGGRGLFMESCQGTTSSPLEIYNNDVDVHEGPNVRVGEGYGCFALRLRPMDGELKNIRVYNNRFIVAGDSVRSTTSYGYIPEALRYSNSISNSNVWFDNNLFKAYAITPGPVESYAITFDGVSGVDSTFKVRNNRFESDHVVVKYGNMNSGASNILLQNDTLRVITPAYQKQTYQVGHLGNNWNNSGNKVIDGAYEGAASDTNIIFTVGGTSDLKLNKTITIQVTGRNGLPVSGATVTAINHYNRSVLTGTTNSDGIYRGVVSYWFESRTATDSTAFNSFTVRARRNTDSTTMTYNVNWSCPAAAIRLNNTDGQGGGDITPPSAIMDLGAVPGLDHGQIRLNWTAPGDDGLNGAASEYVLKYSSSAITEQSWPEATVFENPPSPVEGGFSQWFEMSGFPEGEAFFLAIKSYDDADNASPISNVPRSYAAGVRQPNPINAIVDRHDGTAVLFAATVPSYLPLFYEFALDTSDDFENPRRQVAVMADTAASVVYDSLLPGVNYHWRCRAIASDGSDSSAWSRDMAFDIATGIIMPLTSADCLFPSEGTTIETRKPVFSVRSAPEVSEIFIQVADNPTFRSPVSSGAITMRPGGTTEWQITDGLPYSGSYYWRVSSDNVVWTPPVRFTASIDIHPYPNPYKASEGHRGITFTNLPGGCRIDIATISGDIVKEADGIGPDDWVWDVKNDSGTDVSSGVYLYLVEFERGSTSGKVMVIR